MDNALLYCRKDAAASLAINVRSLDYLLGDGRCKSVRMGRRRLIHQKEIDRLSRNPRLGWLRPPKTWKTEEPVQPPTKPDTNQADDGTNEEDAGEK